MLGGGIVKQLYDLHGQGRSIRAIGKELGVSRNTVRKYLRSPEVPRAKPRRGRASKLDPFKAYIHQRLNAGVDNGEVLLREIRAQGYTGGHSILRAYIQAFRQPRQPLATARFETNPGEQAQVDFGRVQYQGLDGKVHHRWAFVMVLGWSRALYVEMVRRADLSTFVRCHINAFDYLGGLPERCLYDNAKVVVVDRDEAGRPVWNTQFLDFARRLGFSPQLCRPYRAQTKGKVENAIKYVKRNFWLGRQFVDDDDLNKQAQLWADTVANLRVHGTTAERPCDRLMIERAVLTPLPETRFLMPFLREVRKVGRDGFVQWGRAAYGVSWRWSGQEVQVQAHPQRIEIWAGDRRLAVHPRATHPGQRYTLPGQWEGLPSPDRRPHREPMAIQLPTVEVQRRPLLVYEEVQ
jgi:transposase